MNEPNETNLFQVINRRVVFFKKAKNLFRVTLKESTEVKTTSKVKEACSKLVSTLSIHGLPRIVSNENKVVKLAWSIILLVSIGSGIWNITETVRDYCNYDVITNIERISPETVTLPAVTICTNSFHKTSFYKNGSFIKREEVEDIDFRNFISMFAFSPTRDSDINNLEFFSFRSYALFICLRFNGITNRSLETISSTSDYLLIRTKDRYREDILADEYIEYSLSSLLAFVTDNYLNSFNNEPLPIKINPLAFALGKSYSIKIEKTDIEYKLAKPYNNCTDSYPRTSEINYRQANCIEMCINRELGANYNCSVSSYYEVKGLQRCDARFSSIRYRLSFICEKECPKHCETAKLYIKSSVDYSFPGFTTFWFTMSDLTSFKITQIAKINEFGLISSIGGSLGLFVGISLLSLVEIVDILIEVFVIFFTHR